MVVLRRSARTASSVYDSNGREYLASSMGWSRSQLDAWLSSSAVQPHLLLWYNLCYIGGRRFNDGVDWINTGDKGYFYNPSDLEEDILLLCLGEGNVQDMKEEDLQGGYIDGNASTHTWTTQEIWARTAWRIVQGNSGREQAFQKAIIEHPAAAYGFVVEVLCLAFHSLAFRREESVWGEIINGSSKVLLSPSITESDCEFEIPIEVVLDRTPDAMAEEVQTEAGSIASSELSTILEDDGEFEDPEMPKTPKTPPPRIALVSPKTPPPRMGMVSPKAPQQKRTSIFLGEEKTQRVTQWMETVENDPMALDLCDEDGVPITGYRMAQMTFEGLDEAV